MGAARRRGRAGERRRGRPEGGEGDGQVKTFLTDNGILDIEQRGTDPAKAWDNVKKLVDDKIDQ
ncbi:hypothetical protein DRB89_42120 [Streptomyces sp. ICC4]|nr:hypothetical protein DRB89_42120 [Streptomyces sp. ICC4]